MPWQDIAVAPQDRGGVPPAAWPVDAAADPAPGSPAAARKAHKSGISEEEAAALRSRISELEHQLSAALTRLEPERKAAMERGHAEARKEAEIHWSQAFENLNRSVHDLVGTKCRYRRDVEDDAVRLALAIARKVLNREIAADPEALAGLVHVALGRINQRELYRARVHPEDAPRVKHHLTKAGCPERVEVIAEPGLERGALILETERGELDASVQAQLSEIDRGLTDMLRHTK